LGHQRSDTTKIYTFLSGERRKQLYNKYSWFINNKNK
jgi:hypothetical protein